MWKRLKDGGGVILADDMGLGKTLQVRWQANTYLLLVGYKNRFGLRAELFLIVLNLNTGYSTHICLPETLRGQGSTEGSGGVSI